MVGTSMEAFADLKVTIPPELADDFLSKLNYVSQSVEEFELLPENPNRVRFSLRPGHEQHSNLIAAQISDVAQKMFRAFRPAVDRVLVSRVGPGNFKDDPHPLLEAQGQLYCFGQGRFGLGPKLVALMELFDARFREVFATFKAEPHQFPSLIGAEVLEQCKYLRSFPHALTLVSHLREELTSIQRFAGHARWPAPAVPTRVTEGP